MRRSGIVGHPWIFGRFFAVTGCVNPPRPGGRWLRTVSPTRYLADMDAEGWDARYREKPSVWGRPPNRFVTEHLTNLEPGTAIDLAAGEGRNAVWLAERGWSVTAMDFSPVAIQKAREMVAASGVEVNLVVGDARTWEPDESVDLVLIAYLQIADPDRAAVVQRSAGWVRPGGTFFLIAHDRSNVEHGHGGPSDPEVCYDLGETVLELEDVGLEISRAEVVEREVETEDGIRVALDTLVVARTPVH